MASEANHGSLIPTTKGDESQLAKLQFSIVINRPVEEVFAFLSNAENDSKWASGSVEVKKTSEGPVGVGTTWRSVGKFLGQRMESELEVTEYEPNRKYASKVKAGPVPYEARVTFERVEGGTQVNIIFEGEPDSFFKMTEPLVLSMAKRQFESEFAHLKNLMEAHALRT